VCARATAGGHVMRGARQTTLATTAIDQLSRAEVRKSAVGSMVKQLGTDLVTLRSTDPEDLVDRESQLWGPICDWAAQQYGCEVVTSEEWLSIEQNPALMRAVEADLNSRSDWTIAAIDQAGPAALAPDAARARVGRGPRPGGVDASRQGLGGHVLRREAERAAGTARRRLRGRRAPRCCRWRSSTGSCRARRRSRRRAPWSTTRSTAGARLPPPVRGALSGVF
jgi:hypothetical protein